MKTSQITPIALVLILITASCAPTGAHAQGRLVDQQSLGLPSDPFEVHADKFYTQPSGPLGQEFTPTLARLDFVEVFAGQKLGDNHSVNSTGFRVEIHENTLGGAVVGSADGGVSCCGDFMQTVTFQTPVTLTPGNRYVIELSFLYGPLPVGFGYGARSLYPSGRAIFSGTPVEEFSVLFREGAYVAPEPSSMCLMALAALAGAVTIKRRASRSADTELIEKKKLV